MILADTTPKRLHLGVTTQCSFNCQGCFYHQKEEHAWNKRFSKRILDEAREIGVTDIAIGGGEPTEWRLLHWFIMEAKHRGMQVSVTTNGSFNQNMADDLLVADTIHISHDSRHAHAIGWKARDAYIRQVLDYLGPLVGHMGINTLFSDIDKMDFCMPFVNAYTIILDKPVEQPLEPDVVAETVEVISKSAAKCEDGPRVIQVDSCLAEFCKPGLCTAGKCSIYIAANGNMAPCSNIRHRIRAGSIVNGWKKIRRDTDTLPKGCVLHGKI